MGNQLDGVAAKQKEIHEKTKLTLQEKQAEIDTAEMEINRIKRVLEKRDQEIVHQQTQLKISSDRLADIEDELELKSGENNRLRKQVADLEKAMQDLYVSRKGQGDLQIEITSLKLDNEKLLELLKETTEYADHSDSQIMQAAGRTKASSGQTKTSQTGAKKTKIDNDWIPTEAVRAILKIRDDFKGTMTETAISQILYELNSIWRNIMRKENDAIKKRLTEQI